MHAGSYLFQHALILTINCNLCNEDTIICLPVVKDFGIIIAVTISSIFHQLNSVSLPDVQGLCF